MYVKTYQVKNGLVVAICDKELVGRVLKEGELVLDLDKYSQFYVGEITGPEKAGEILKQASSINLVGKRAVGLALSAGLAKKGSERTIMGVPHLQVYVLEP